MSLPNDTSQRPSLSNDTSQNSINQSEIDEILSVWRKKLSGMRIIFAAENTRFLADREKCSICLDELFNNSIKFYSFNSNKLAHSLCYDKNTLNNEINEYKREINCDENCLICLDKLFDNDKYNNNVIMFKECSHFLHKLCYADYIHYYINYINYQNNMIKCPLCNR